MKILVIGILIGFVSFHRAAAQGVVNFGNRPLPGDRRIFDVDRTTPISGINFIVELLYQNNTGVWVAHPLKAPFFDSSLAAFAGYWNGGNRTLVNAGAINPRDPTEGLPVNMQVRVWDGGSSTIPLTFDQAVAVGMKWGASDVFVYIEEFSDPRSNSDFYMQNFQSFSLVPEPSAWALFALGMGWLFWRNRKEKS